MRHSARARAQVALACAALLAATPATGLAASNPVHVDPKSPVAKEYAIPLATARGAAPESGQAGALFGSGISSSSHTVTSPSTDPRPTPASAPAHTPAPAAHTRPATTVEATPAAYRVLRAGSGSGLLWMILAAVVVIGLGSAGGFLLSRQR